MADEPQRQKDRDSAISALNTAIVDLDITKAATSTKPENPVFGSVAMLLTEIRDTMANQQDYVDLGLSCATICKVLERVMDGKSLNDLSESVCDAANQLTKTVAGVRRMVLGHKLHGAIGISQPIHSRDERDAIAAWKSNLERILQVFITELATKIQTIEARQASRDDDSVVSESSRLTDHYPAAYKDFFGMPSGAPCIYKSGPAWPERTGLEAQPYIRELRPVYGHSITNSWFDIGTDIYKCLDSRSVQWTSIDPVGFANAGEDTPFCPLLMWIGVRHKTLSFDNAVSAANAVKDILCKAGFPEIEVAFRESVVTRSVGGPKLLPFNPLIDSVPNFRKPFTPTLGLSIAPLEDLGNEGTGTLYFRLSKDNNRVVLLTAAHVAWPLHEHLENVGMKCENPSQTRDENSSKTRNEIIALGPLSYQTATKAMKADIDRLGLSVKVLNSNITRLGSFVEGENPKVTQRRQENQSEVDKVTKTIDDLNDLHNEVTKYGTPEKRIIGFVLHTDAIVREGYTRYTSDWGFVELYREQIEWETFPGNKVYVGGNLPPEDFGRFMFPHTEDQKDYQYPVDGLLQAHGVVKDEEICQPQHLERNGTRALFVVKNGSTTGTTIGRVNGLKSFNHYYPEYKIGHAAMEISILPYDKEHAPFSGPGDSGAIILDRAGRIVGLLTGGCGENDGTGRDITCATPYWWLEGRIKEAYPDCYLYDIVN